MVFDDTEEITNKLHGRCALLLTPTDDTEEITNKLHYSRVLERVKSCVPFFVRVLGFYSSRA